MEGLGTGDARAGARGGRAVGGRARVYRARRAASVRAAGAACLASLARGRAPDTSDSASPQGGGCTAPLQRTARQARVRSRKSRLVWWSQTTFSWGAKWLPLQERWVQRVHFKRGQRRRGQRRHGQQPVLFDARRHQRPCALSAWPCLHEVAALECW